MYMSDESLTFARDVLKDVSRDELISSRQYFQDEHVKLSNENYRIKQDVEKIINFIDKEIDRIENTDEDENPEDGEVIYDNGRLQGKYEVYVSIKRMLKCLL